MYRAGQKEIDAVAEVIRSGKLFRYREGGECARFETRYAETLGAKYVCITSSGSTALAALAMLAAILLIAHNRYQRTTGGRCGGGHTHRRHIQ